MIVKNLYRVVQLVLNEEIARDINDSYLLCDMSHVSGLIATQEFNNPFEYCPLCLNFYL